MKAGRERELFGRLGVVVAELRVLDGRRQRVLIQRDALVTELFEDADIPWSRLAAVTGTSQEVLVERWSAENGPAEAAAGPAAG